MSNITPIPNPFEPDETTRDVTIGGNAEGSIVISGNSNIIYVDGMPVAIPVVAHESGASFRVLTIVARALDVSELPDIADAWSLADGLRAVEAPAEISFLRPPTRNRLDLQLDRGWDVLHFDGHGTAEDGGFLVFEKQDGLRDLLPTSEFIDLLKRAAQPPKLIILSACQSAKGKNNLAERLVNEANVPAVIGFSETVPVDLTMAFVSRLYAAIGAGRSILDSFNAAKDFLRGQPPVVLPPETEDEPPREIEAVNFPVLFGNGTNEFLCPGGQRGSAQVEREPLIGVPSPSESGQFYGVYADGNPPQGRKGLLVQGLRAILRGEKMVLLIGQGGIGKTAIAAALSRRIAWRFPGGVFWVNGSDYLDTGLHIDDALNVFAAKFGNEFLKLDAAQKRQAVLTYLEQIDAPALWVIDNADIADEKVWQIARQVGGRSVVLLTSRERPEHGGSLIDVEGMVPNEAISFLIQEIRRRKNDPIWGLAVDTDGNIGWGLKEDETRQLMAIAQLVDGHALALLHAAALVADEGLTAAEKAVKANPARGDTSRRFDFSYARLGENEKRLLHRLSAFATDFDVNAIEWVCTTPLEEADKDLLPEWEEHLRELVRRSFVEVHQWNENYRRYRLHPVLREYARQKSGAMLSNDERRMARYFLAMADAASKLLGDTEKALGAVAFAERERLNLLAGQDIYANHEKHEEVISFAYRLDDLFERSGQWDARRRALEAGLQAAEKTGGGEYAAMLHNLAILAQDTGDYPEARKLYEQSLKIKEQLGDKAGVAQTLYQLGSVAYLQGDYPEARKLYEQAAKNFEELGAQSGQAAVLHQLGILAQQTGDYPAARKLYEQSLAIAEQLGDKAGVAQTLHQLGSVAYLQGDYPEARKLYEQSLAIAEQLGDKAGVATTLHQLGVSAQQTGDYAEARKLYEQSLEIKEQLGDKAGVATTLHQLGMLAQATGDYPAARKLYAQSLKIKEQLGDKAGVAISKAQQALLEEKEGNFQRALTLITEAEAIFTSLGAPQREQARKVRERIEEKLKKQ